MPTIETLSGKKLSINYMARDFESYRADVLNTGGLADLYTPSWTDRSELDLGVALTEVFSFFGDNLAFYQDRCVNEAFLPTATQRRSVIQHCRGINHELAPNISASVELTFVTNAAGTLTENSQISVDVTDGSDPATFELDSDFVSTGAGTYTGIIAYHGTTVADEALGSSDGSAGQEFSLAQSPLTSQNSSTKFLTTTVDEGIPEDWTEVDNFLESAATDKVYRVEIDEYDTVKIIFGDGVNGKIPNTGASISGSYRIGGGNAGNQVGVGKLTKVNGSYSFIDSVTNPAKPSGGQDKESIATAKKLAPAGLVAQNRAVRHDDYAYIAIQGGASKAYAYRGRGAYEENIVVAVSGSNPVPTGSWDPYTESGSGSMYTIGAYVQAHCTTPVIVQIIPVSPVDLLLSMVVYALDNYRATDVERLVLDAIKAEIKTDNQEFGQQVPLSLIYDIVEDVTGVDYLNVNRFQRIPYARQLTGSASLTFGSLVYGLNTPRDTWTIKFLNATTFTVSGYSSGNQVNTGTVGVAYLVDDESFGFTVSGSPTAAEKWEMITGPYKDNIDPQEYELCRLYNDDFTISVVGGAG